jgi:hypothetical protein
MKPKKQYLSRTGYRNLRIKIILNCISLLCNMLILNKLELEKIHLAYFKNLEKIIQNRRFEG